MSTQYDNALRDCRLVNQWLADTSTITQAEATDANDALAHIPAPELMVTAKADRECGFIADAKRYNRR